MVLLGILEILLIFFSLFFTLQMGASDVVQAHFLAYRHSLEDFFSNSLWGLVSFYKHYVKPCGRHNSLVISVHGLGLSIHRVHWVVFLGKHFTLVVLFFSSWLCFSCLSWMCFCSSSVFLILVLFSSSQLGFFILVARENIQLAAIFKFFFMHRKKLPNLSFVSLFFCNVTKGMKLPFLCLSDYFIKIKASVCFFKWSLPHK